MRYILHIVMVVAALFFVGCDNIFEDERGTSVVPAECGELMIAIEEETRTFVQDNTTLCWHADDRLSIFYGNTANVEYRFDGKDGDVRGVASAVGGASGSGEALDRVYALYPYSSTAEITTSGRITTELPAEQCYAKNSFGRGANSMVAATKSVDDKSLSFKNLCGYIKLKLYGDAKIKSIKLQGNAGEKIAGNATVEYASNGEPTVAMVNGATDVIVLDCGDGVQLAKSANSATIFWFVVPATTFENGISVEVTEVDGRVYTHSTSKRVCVERNKIQPMSPFEPLFPYPAPEDNELWYTTTNGDVISFDSSGFGVEMVSNTYANGRGVITFASKVERIGNNSFKNDSKLKSITLPQTVTAVGDYAFSGCSSLADVLMPEGLISIGTEAFANCSALKRFEIPSTVTTFGAYPFYHSDATELVINCNIPDADESLDPVTMAFTETYFSNVTFTSRVRSIGNFSFGWNNYIETITLNYGLERIGDGAFYDNRLLRSVAIPESVKSIGEYAFYSCDVLSTVTCYATTVPQLGADAFPSGTIVNVPDTSVVAYKNHAEWKKYTIYNLAGEEYKSTDYSAQGEIVVLQKATKGDGIDIVMLGDGYSDRQIAAGYYMNDLSRAVDMLFSEEPYKSFREFFNIYVVKCVSRYEGIVEGRDYGSTAFNCTFNTSSSIKGDDSTAYSYASKVVGEERLDEVLIVVILNSSNYGGVAYLKAPSLPAGDETCNFGNGSAVTYFPLCGNDDTLRGLILHEAGGHGFAKLGDEYFYSQNTAVSNHDYYLGKELETFGWYRNIDFVLSGTLDETNIKWRHFLEDEHYAYDGLGVFEGAYTYIYGAYRPTDISIMRHNEGGFNAPSREAIYIRIHKLAYGYEWNYDYEEFVAYDAINRKSAPSALTKSSVVYDEAHPHTAPVVRRR